MEEGHQKMDKSGHSKKKSAPTAASKEILRLLAHLKVEFASISLDRCTGFFRFGPEWNYRHAPPDFNRLYLIEDGHAEVTWNGRTHALCPGYAYLFPCGADLALRCPKSVSLWRTHFNLWTVGHTDLFEFATLPRPRIRPTRDFRACFRRLCENFPPQNVAQALSCIRDLTHLIEPFLEEVDSRRLFARMGERIVFEPALKLAEGSLGKELRVEDMAAAMDLSPEYFAKRFRKAFDCTPRRYLNRRRIAKAKQLLLSTTLSSKEICFQCGFRDPYYFSRLFKQLEGLSARAYRKRFAIALQE